MFEKLRQRLRFTRWRMLRRELDKLETLRSNLDAETYPELAAKLDAQHDRVRAAERKLWAHLAHEYTIIVI